MHDMFGMMDFVRGYNAVEFVIFGGARPTVD